MSVPEIPCKNSSYKRKLAAEIAKLWYVTLGKYGTNKLDVTACSNWHYEYNKNQSNDQMKQWEVCVLCLETDSHFFYKGRRL